MSFYGYLLGGLIRVGYMREEDGHIDLKKIVTNGRATVRDTMRAAKPAIRAEVKKRYTYKGAISIRSRSSGMNGELRVRGSRLRLNKFRVKGGVLGRRGRSARIGTKLYVQVIRGQGGVIERGFRMNSGGKFEGTYWRRDTPASLPIHMLYGPSVAEMAGHEPQPATLIQARIEQVLSERMTI